MQPTDHDRSIERIDENNFEDNTTALDEESAAERELLEEVSPIRSPKSLTASFTFTSTKPKLKRSSSTKVTRRENRERASSLTSNSGSCITDDRYTVTLPVSATFSKNNLRLPDIDSTQDRTHTPNTHQTLSRTRSSPLTIHGRTSANRTLTKLPHYPIPPPSPCYSERGHTYQDGLSGSPPSLSASWTDADSQLNYWGELLQASRRNTPSVASTGLMGRASNSTLSFSASWDESRHQSSRDMRLNHSPVSRLAPTKEETPEWLVALKGRKHVSMDEVEKLAALMNSCKAAPLTNTSATSHTQCTSSKEPKSYMKSTESSIYKRRRAGSGSMNLNSSLSSSFNSSH